MANINRDAVATLALSKADWRVATVWECALRDDSDAALNQLAGFIRSERLTVEIGSPQALT